MNECADRLVAYLLAQGWQVAVLAVIVGLASWALKNRSAHLRYLLWLIVLAKCLVPPFLTVPVAVLPQTDPSSLAATPSLAEEYFPPEMPVSVGSVTEPRETKHASLSILETVALVWAGGALVFLLWVGGRAVRYTSWLRGRRKPLPHALEAPIRDLSAGFGFKTSPKVWLVGDIGQPFVWGLLRGSVYLPADFADLPRSDQQRSVLAHELSHIARFDAGVNSLQVVAQCLYWFHPFVWWSNKKMRREREKCCDEMAVARLSTAPEHYTRAIVDALAAERRPAHPVPSLAVVGSVRDIEERIRTMLKPGKTFRTRPTLVAVTVASLIALVTVPTALVVTARAQTPLLEPAPRPAADSEKPEPARYAARTFNSKMAFEVFVDDDGLRSIGRTPSATPLEIPPCVCWEVEPVGPVEDWDLLISEMSQNSVPGLRLRATDSDSRHLAGFTGLEFLDLTNAKITDASFVHLKGMTGLWGLSLVNTQITGPGIEHLKGLRRLQWLFLNRTPFTDAGLYYLKDLKELRQVALANTQITDDGLEHLKGLSELQTLGLQNNRVTDGGLVHLKALTSLRNLSLNDTLITDAGLEHLKGLTGLRDLNLSHDEIAGSGLANLAGMTGLRRLWLSGTRMTDAGLAHLKGLTGLRVLEMGGTQITNAGLIHLKGLTELQTLKLGGTKIAGDAGLEYLKNLTRLQVLSLNGTRITDAGLEQLESLTKLQDLGLSKTPITDAGMVYLKGLTQLRRLDLTGTQVTDAGVQQLKQSLPNLTVGRDDGRPTTQNMNDPALAANKPATNREKTEQPRYAARTFNSKAAFKVVVVETSAGFNPRTVGSTPSAAPLEIPACYIWWVQPSVPVKDWDLLAREINENKVPGLKLDLATNADTRGMLPGLTSESVMDAEMKHLAGLTGLQWLNLSGTQVGDAGLAELKGLKALQYLRLDDTQVTDSGLEHLKGLTSLQTVILMSTKTTDAGLAHLKGMTGLQDLRLGKSQITDAGLAQLTSLTGLQTLDLNHLPITDAGLEPLNHLTGLQELNLGSTQITAAGLTRLRGMTSLRQLGISGIKISDAGLEHLKVFAGLQTLNMEGMPLITDAGFAHLRGLTRLQWLDLADTKITDAGLAQLKDKDLPRLWFLELAGTQVTDGGLTHLKVLTKLQNLFLSDTWVTDEGMAYLANMPGLRVLYLNGTQITDTGLERLASGLTGLEILVWGKPGSQMQAWSI